MAGNNGPWGGGGNRGSGGGRPPERPGGPPRRPQGQQVPEIDEIVRKGQEQLRVLMGGRGPRGEGGGPGGGPTFTRGTALLVGGAALLAWLFASVYTVRPEEQSVELFLGEFSSIGNPGLNIAPWPLVTREVISVSTQRTVEVGVGRGSQRGEDGLMLTTDENIVDIDFQVVWNISNPADFLFNLADPEETVTAVSEAAMREVIAQSELAPILNRDRGLIADTVRELIQATLDSYDAGINVVRLNLDRADPPSEVIDAFRDVQAAEQERDRLQRQADRYANEVLAGARGEAAQVLEQAEAYRAQVVNEAEGEAARFLSVLGEYAEAPEVTRRRLYLETIEEVYGRVDKIILDGDAGGGGGSASGVIPFMSLNEFTRQRQQGTN